MEYAVVMAGGAGTRLWPSARREFPKQLQSLIFEQPLIAETCRRLAQIYAWERILVVTGKRYAASIAEILPELPAENIIGEPVGRNTAAAIALAAFRMAAEDADAIFGVFPADHVILKPDALFRAVRFASSLAQQHRVVDIGVPPSHPETGYGYIELGREIASGDGLAAHEVIRFVEKPDLEHAQRYVQAGTYIWNSGMFVWRVGQYLAALRQNLPQTYAQLGPVAASGDQAQLARAYEQIPDISVDYAIMEKVSDVVAIPIDFGWRDIGDWNALYEMMEHDADGNAANGAYVTLDTSGSLLLAPHKLVAAIGVEDLVLVDTEDVLLVMRRDRAQDVKKVLDRLKERGDTRYL